MPALTREEIETLTPQERPGLIGALWESLGVPDEPVPEWHLRELERRLETPGEDLTQGSLWEAVKAKYPPAAS